MQPVELEEESSTRLLSFNSNAISIIKVNLRTPKLSKLTSSPPPTLRNFILSLPPPPTTSILSPPTTSIVPPLLPPPPIPSKFSFSHSPFPTPSKFSFSQPPPPTATIFPPLQSSPYARRHSNLPQNIPLLSTNAKEQTSWRFIVTAGSSTLVSFSLEKSSTKNVSPKESSTYKKTIYQKQYIPVDGTTTTPRYQNPARIKKMKTY